MKQKVEELRSSSSGLGVFVLVPLYPVQQVGVKDQVSKYQEPGWILTD
jgi:hypothetical protein